MFQRAHQMLDTCAPKEGIRAAAVLTVRDELEDASNYFFPTGSVVIDYVPTWTNHMVVRLCRLSVNGLQT